MLFHAESIIANLFLEMNQNKKHETKQIWKCYVKK